MKVVILAGGLGTRLAEETEVKPKPMVEIGGRPILWHILKHYARHGVTESYIALGYKGEAIKRYFLDYYSLAGDMRVDTGTGRAECRGRETDRWTVNLIDTGQATNTGGRVKRLEKHLAGGTFLLTYGDGVSNVDVQKLLAFHRRAGRVATVTAVRPPARFGGLEFNGDLVARFTEKPQVGEGWINGGFLAFEPEVFRYLDGDDSSLEAHCLERLAAAGQLAAYKHDGFWQCMDTLRDKRMLEALWLDGRAPWKTWDDPAEAAEILPLYDAKRKAS
jgi:glucose-1-phosphate cytidylyltransferase